MSDEYNGWCNRETWAVALHLSNDPDLYDIARSVVREEDKRQTDWQDEHGWEHPGTDLGGFAAERLEDWITEAANDVLHATHASQDALNSTKWIRMLLSDVGSLWRVDWYAVADSFRDE